MNLEQLKKAMEAAAAKAAENPEDEALKAAAEEAKDAYEAAKAEADKGEDDSGDEPDESKLDEKTKAYIAKLRKENANRRLKEKDLKSKLSTTEAQKKAILKAAGIELEEEDPETKLKTVNEQNGTLAFRAAILESALEHGIPHSSVEYYEFLVSKATSQLEDGDELTEDQLSEIVQKVKALGGKGAANSSVGMKKGKEGQAAPNPNSKSEMTLSKFVKMTIAEKSKLYEENRELYQQLVQEARSKKMLV